MHTSLAAVAVALSMAFSGHGLAAPTVPALASAPALASGQTQAAAYDAAVEAIHQTVIAAQVPGAIVALLVHSGDTVKQGQLLLRIDARAANQNASASEAQVRAAHAALDVARQQVERQRQLYQKRYISEAALERAEAEFKSAQAQVTAQGAQAGAARTESGFYQIRAPFGGVVSDVPVALGDMALPGRPLLTLYDPSALRVTAALPQSVAQALRTDSGMRVELNGIGGAATSAPVRSIQVLPTTDPATHTTQVRVNLPTGFSGAAPGGFARLWVANPSTTHGIAGAAVSIPGSAVFHRAELSAVYVIDTNGRPLLRQVRLGPVQGDRVEVLAGLSVGDVVATDPQAAARIR